MAWWHHTLLWEGTWWGHSGPQHFAFPNPSVNSHSCLKAPQLCRCCTATGTAGNGVVVPTHPNIFPLIPKFAHPFQHLPTHPNIYSPPQHLPTHPKICPPTPTFTHHPKFSHSSQHSPTHPTSPGHSSAPAQQPQGRKRALSTPQFPRGTLFFFPPPLDLGCGNNVQRAEKVLSIFFPSCRHQKGIVASITDYITAGFDPLKHRRHKSSSSFSLCLGVDSFLCSEVSQEKMEMGFMS